MNRIVTESFILTLAVLIPITPASAQHPAARHPAATPHAATHPSMMPGGVQPHVTPQQHKQMQQQQQAMQKEMQRQMQMEMQHQEMMMHQMQKNHQEHMNHFNNWMQQQQKAASGTTTSTGTGSTSTSTANASHASSAVEGLPTFTSHQHFQKWLSEQKHRKATKKAYHLGYDRYMAYMGYTQNVRNLVTNLHSSRQLLAPLKTDYAGHRVQAMGHIGDAINSLHNTAIGPKPMLASTSGSTGSLSQASSDERMRRALTKLQSVQSHLTLTSGIPNHSVARQSVEGAIQELNMALTVR